MKFNLTSMRWCSKRTGQELQGPSRMVIDFEPEAGMSLTVQLDELLQARFLDNDETDLAVSSYSWEAA